ncbi:MAG: DUF2079 domain-containing protein [Candidatus Omnitrophica bacterium]|nr:DUF2079 domain-containing protein [Candidatus Omnitrophota bacterium]
MRETGYYKNKDLGLIVVFILSLIFTLSFGLVNILKFKIFSSTCFGWHLFNSYLRIGAGKSIFDVYILPEFPIVMYLFAPINYLIAFIYKLLPHPEILLVFQSIIMASGAPAVYLLTKHRLRNTYLAIAFSVSYLLNPIISTGAILGYISPALGLPFLLFAFYYLEKDDFKKFIFFIILACISKIDVVVMVLILGMILAFSKTKQRYGKAILKISIIWLVVSFALCYILLKIKGRPFPVEMLHFDQYGDNLTYIIRHLLNNSWIILNNLFNAQNMLFYAFCFLPNILAFISPLYLLPIIPEVLFLSIRNQHSSGLFLLLPFVFVAAIFGTGKIIKALADHKGFILKREPLCIALAGIILLFSLGTHYYIKPISDFKDKLGVMPFTRGFSLKFYDPTKHTKTGYKFLKMIPVDSSCFASQSLAAHLGGVSYLGRTDRFTLAENYAWDYIFLDLSKKDFYLISDKDYFLRLKKFLVEDNYGVVGFEDGWLLLQKGYKQDKNSEVLNYMNGVLLDEKKI